MTGEQDFPCAVCGAPDADWDDNADELRCPEHPGKSKMGWGYSATSEQPVLAGGLLEIAIEYLESKGWYFDQAWYREVWEEGDAGPRGVRESHCWTIPQWGEYWAKPYYDDPKHENYGAPKERRYESLKDALWSQILREQEPEPFETFFRDRTKT